MWLENILSDVMKHRKELCHYRLLQIHTLNFLQSAIPTWQMFEVTCWENYPPARHHQSWCHLFISGHMNYMIIHLQVDKWHYHNCCHLSVITLLFMLPSVGEHINHLCWNPSVAWLLNIKVKGVPYRAHMAQWGKEGIAPLFLNLCTGRG
jgi:hypothetical protein